MKTGHKITSLALLLSLSFLSCESSDRTTGNEEAAAQSQKHSVDSVSDHRPDTTVTGVPGNSNAVNSSGNAGNGSGMGSSSTTEAQKKN